MKKQRTKIKTLDRFILRKIDIEFIFIGALFAPIAFWNKNAGLAYLTILFFGCLYFTIWNGIESYKNEKTKNT